MLCNVFMFCIWVNIYLATDEDWYLQMSVLPICYKAVSGRSRTPAPILLKLMLLCFKNHFILTACWRCQCIYLLVYIPITPCRQTYMCIYIYMYVHMYTHTPWKDLPTAYLGKESKQAASPNNLSDIEHVRKIYRQPRLALKPFWYCRESSSCPRRSSQHLSIREVCCFLKELKFHPLKKQSHN